MTDQSNEEIIERIEKADRDRDQLQKVGMKRISEFFDYYLWRINLLRCLYKHDWKNVYTRVSMDGHYSGKNECVRCYKNEYFAGDYK